MSLILSNESKDSNKYKFHPLIDGYLKNINVIRFIDGYWLFSVDKASISDIKEYKNNRCKCESAQCMSGYWLAAITKNTFQCAIRCKMCRDELVITFA